MLSASRLLATLPVIDEEGCRVQVGNYYRARQHRPPGVGPAYVRVITWR